MPQGWGRVRGWGMFDLEGLLAAIRCHPLSIARRKPAASPRAGPTAAAGPAKTGTDPAFAASAPVEQASFAKTAQRPDHAVPDRLVMPEPLPHAHTAPLQDWLGEGGFSTIKAYDKGSEQLVVVYDPIRHPKPQLGVQRLAMRQRSLILLDGCVIAAVEGHIAREDICLLAT